MRPPEFTGGNLRQRGSAVIETLPASMRPPEFTGGNGFLVSAARRVQREASMRPPEFTGGNVDGSRIQSMPATELQ